MEEIILSVPVVAGESASHVIRIAADASYIRCGGATYQRLGKLFVDFAADVAKRLPFWTPDGPNGEPGGLLTELLGLAHTLYGRKTMHLDDFKIRDADTETFRVVRELIRDRCYTRAICYLAAKFPPSPNPNDGTSDAILAAACRDIADRCADDDLNPETDR